MSHAFCPSQLYPNFIRNVITISNLKTKDWLENLDIMSNLCQPFKLQASSYTILLDMPVMWHLIVNVNFSIPDGALIVQWPRTWITQPTSKSHRKFHFLDPTSPQVALLVHFHAKYKVQSISDQDAVQFKVRHRSMPRTSADTMRNWHHPCASGVTFQIIFNKAIKARNFASGS